MISGLTMIDILSTCKTSGALLDTNCMHSKVGVLTIVEKLEEYLTRQILETTLQFGKKMAKKP